MLDKWPIVGMREAFGSFLLLVISSSFPFILVLVENKFLICWNTLFVAFHARGRRSSFATHYLSIYYDIVLQRSELILLNIMSSNLHDSDRASQLNPQDNASIHSVSTTDDHPEHLRRIDSHISTHDTPMQHYSSYIEVPDEVYDRLKSSRKVVIVALLSYCSFLAPISSTTILAAVPEVAATYSSTGTIINLSNALYMVFMGISPCFWGPLSQVYGRRWV
jgi:hypothetical protein